jgi:hypothetical protein
MIGIFWVWVYVCVVLLGINYYIILVIISSKLYYAISDRTIKILPTATYDMNLIDIASGQAYYIYRDMN